EHLQRSRPVTGLQDEVARLREREADQLPQVAIVVCGQNLHVAVSVGNVISIRVLPRSVRVSTIVPAWRSMMDLTIHRPRPNPPGSGSSSAPRRKRAKMASVSEAAGPGPSSSTQVTTLASSVRAPMRTVLPSGANLLAFASRLT